MKRVYVAGAYSADNVIDVLKNIGKGEKIASDLFLKGFASFTPWHDKAHIFYNADKDFAVELFYKFSMAWLDVSDLMLVIPGYENSKGTLAEIERAKELGIKIYYDFEELVNNE